ncbi:MAG: hypothetical protein JRI23_21470 [Deltaproteobacteria bacterium]|jgi:hypothetical protein|nr:hypothetical protein [Deltaproteobacteria bacterium]MBW2534512.1 hypothetical protein [Deltaproteobacteria bacterium]
MPAIDTEWKVLPHGELERLADNVWRVEGDLPNMGLKRCMTVARTAPGELVLHSAIAMDEEHMAELEALGTPAFLVVPNGWHCLDAARFKARYPSLQVVCPKKARKMVGKKVPSVDGDYGDFAKLDEEGSVRLEHFDAERHVEGAMVVQSDDGLTLVFADSLFNLPHQEGFFWWLYGRVLGSTGGPKVTVIGRAMMLLSRSKKPFRNWLVRYADRGDVVRLVPGHGAVVRERASAVLREVADSLG